MVTVFSIVEITYSIAICMADSEGSMGPRNSLLIRKPNEIGYQRWNFVKLFVTLQTVPPTHVLPYENPRSMQPGINLLKRFWFRHCFDILNRKYHG